jgi:hypothetical protein
MTNDPDPSSLDGPALQALDETLHAKLVATRTLVGHLAVALRDPSALEPASELLRATLALLDRPGRRDRDELLREVELTNAILVAVVDLVKSHADTPKAHRPRPKSERH